MNWKRFGIGFTIALLAALFLFACFLFIVVSAALGDIIGIGVFPGAVVGLVLLLSAVFGIVEGTKQ